MMLKMKYYWIITIFILIQLFLSACATFPYYSHYNVKADPQKKITHKPKAPSGAYLASEDVQWEVDWQCRNNWQFDKNTMFFNPIDACPKNDNNFIGIAISGGGSRSAVFSAAVFFELERYGILQQVDVISSVSGGSFTAAYYVLSCDDARNCPPTVEGPDRFKWDPKDVFPKLERNFIARWISNSFWIENIVRYWLTYYDRTDVMVETIADNLYDNSLLGGKGFRFQDLNPQRPYLIINATNNTENVSETRIFSFTRQHFDELQSSLDRYPIANAVMASSAFPAVFQSVTLKDFSKKDDQYVHLFDGGASDNLGISSLREILERNNDSDSKKLIILIDAYNPTHGKNPRDPNPRSFIDYFVDTNFLDAYETLMAELRHGKTNELQKWLEENNGKLVHLQFSDLKENHPELYETVKKIETNLYIKRNEAACLKHAARILVREKMDELRNNSLWEGLIQFPPRKGYELQPCTTKREK
ncbi:MAG: patatin-like phospholipase family protein [Deltaproteobacteria bacterium]|nr:patatin-like phospholipase family protein [Deltaproteobacteria bacterium]